VSKDAQKCAVLALDAAYSLSSQKNLNVMLEKPNKELEPAIAGPVIFALVVLASIILLIWGAS
jgi:hypothetical protein